MALTPAERRRRNAIELLNMAMLMAATSGSSTETVAVLTLVDDGLETATPYYTFSSTAAGTLRWDFHTSATPPAAGSGDLGTGTQTVSSGNTVFSIDLSPYPGTGYLHFRVINSAGTSNILTSQVITVPSANAVWLDVGSLMTKSNGDRDVEVSGGWSLARANGSGKSSGKWYYEIHVITGASNSGSVAPGFADATTAAGALMANSITIANSGAARGVDNLNLGNVTYPGSYGFNPSAIEAPGDIIGVHLDLDNREMYYSFNGAYVGGSDPSSRTNPRVTWGTSWTVWPACYLFLDGKVRLVTSGCTYTPDTGFSEYGA